MNRFILIIFVILLFNSCAKSVQEETEIYSNDFEAADLEGISNGKIISFNGTKVLGNYNNGQFDLKINDLPAHNMVEISFDLYIHDSWEGSQSFNDNVSGPDLWQLRMDSKTYINATFANFDCTPGNFCPGQSYPADYPTQSNNPKSGASEVNLPGLCRYAGKAQGTTLYKIHKSISHSDKTILIECLDKLIQKDVSDPECDESWSVDNIKVKVIKLN
jgi:hypothetical protein